MYLIFFRVDEVLRDEDDFNPDDDDLLVEDHQAKDQEMKDMDESGPHEQNARITQMFNYNRLTSMGCLLGNKHF
jgi:hypothetical protein